MSAYDKLMKKWIDQGLEQGIEQGIEQGKEKRTYEATVKMIKKGLDHQTIIEVLEVTSEFIEKVSNEMESDS